MKIMYITIGCENLKYLDYKCHVSLCTNINFKNNHDAANTAKTEHGSPHLFLLLKFTEKLFKAESLYASD